jgi:hypothetical protein
VKRELLILHPIDQFLDPIKQWLIRHAGRYRTVMFDLLVDLYTLLAHCSFALSGGSNQPTYHDTTPVELFCFNPVSCATRWASACHSIAISVHASRVAESVAPRANPSLANALSRYLSTVLVIVMLRVYGGSVKRKALSHR